MCIKTLLQAYIRCETAAAWQFETSDGKTDGRRLFDLQLVCPCSLSGFQSTAIADSASVCVSGCSDDMLRLSLFQVMQERQPCLCVGACMA
jgi:hypothetical protein